MISQLGAAGHLSDENIEILARVLGDMLTPGYDTLYEDKIDWLKDRGLRHDINVPFKSELRDAVEALVYRILQE